MGWLFVAASQAAASPLYGRIPSSSWSVVSTLSDLQEACSVGG